jgi:hypothetical protein
MFDCRRFRWEGSQKTKKGGEFHSRLAHFRPTAVIVRGIHSAQYGAQGVIRILDILM